MDHRMDWKKAFFIGALALVCANALLYTARQANPLVMSDEWVYLDSFVRKAAASDLTLFDFFAKRSGMDHANPLRRLVLLMHYEWFDLDYSVQGLVGILFAFANLAVLWRIAAPRDAGSRGAPWFLAGFLAIAAVYLSLNSGMIYTWPLMTMAFSNQFFVLLCILQAWKANNDASRRPALVLFGAAFAMNVVADDTALLASIAMMGATLVWRMHGLDRRESAASAAKSVALPMLAAYMAYKAMYFLVTRGAYIAAPLSDRLSMSNKLAQLAQHPAEMLVALHVPFVASLVQRTQFNRLFGPESHAAEWVLAIMVACAHAWYWWRAGTRRTGRAGFAAIALMLYSYGCVAAILIGRASVYGAHYFWQPRYVFLYQLSIVALLLMAIDAASLARVPAVAMRAAPLARKAVVAFACILMLLQCRLSAWTWQGIGYSDGFQRKLARQIGELAAHPDKNPEKCVPALILCRYPPGQRAELLRFLQDNQLNVFSPAFQARHGLFPGKRRQSPASSAASAASSTRSR